MKTLARTEAAVLDLAVGLLDLPTPERDLVGAADAAGVERRGLLELPVGDLEHQVVPRGGGVLCPRWIQRTPEPRPAVHDPPEARRAAGVLVPSAETYFEGRREDGGQRRSCR